MRLTSKKQLVPTKSKKYLKTKN